MGMLGQDIRLPALIVYDQRAGADGRAAEQNGRRSQTPSGQSLSIERDMVPLLLSACKVGGTMVGKPGGFVDVGADGPSDAGGSVGSESSCPVESLNRSRSELSRSLMNGARN